MCDSTKSGEIAKLLGLSESRSRVILNELINEGLIEP